MADNIEDVARGGAIGWQDAVRFCDDKLRSIGEHPEPDDPAVKYRRLAYQNARFIFQSWIDEES